MAAMRPPCRANRFASFSGEQSSTISRGGSGISIVARDFARSSASAVRVAYSIVVFAVEAAPCFLASACSAILWRLVAWAISGARRAASAASCASKGATTSRNTPVLRLPGGRATATNRLTPSSHPDRTRTATRLAAAAARTARQSRAASAAGVWVARARASTNRRVASGRRWVGKSGRSTSANGVGGSQGSDSPSEPSTSSEAPGASPSSGSVLASGPVSSPPVRVRCELGACPAAPASRSASAASTAPRTRDRSPTASWWMASSVPPWSR